MTRGVAGPGREALDPVSLDHAVGDHPHRPSGHVGLDVPLRRSGREVGAATPAGPEAGALGTGRGHEEHDVLALWRCGGARTPAAEPRPVAPRGGDTAATKGSA